MVVLVGALDDVVDMEGAFGGEEYDNKALLGIYMPNHATSAYCAVAMMGG